MDHIAVCGPVRRENPGVSDGGPPRNNEIGHINTVDYVIDLSALRGPPRD